MNENPERASESRCQVFGSELGEASGGSEVDRDGGSNLRGKFATWH